MSVVDLLILLIIVILLVFIILGTSYNNFCASQYDYQSSETFSGNFSSLSYNVVVLNQSDSFGKGPAYLLNGLTNKGYWYQIGIGYNWSKYGTHYATGFSLISYLEFVTTTNATSVGNTIRSGDTVLLSMYFKNSNVILQSYDWNTGVSNEITFPSFNATYFVGGPYKNGSNNDTSDVSGHFTGLMTEWWHPQIYTKTQMSIIYTPYTTYYNNTQLLVNNVGPIPQPTTDTFGGQLTSLTCAFDLYNSNKQLLKQTETSSLIKINNSTVYDFSPFENVTLQVHGREFITK